MNSKIEKIQARIFSGISSPTVAVVLLILCFGITYEKSIQSVYVVSNVIKQRISKIQAAVFLSYYCGGRIRVGRMNSVINAATTITIAPINMASAIPVVNA